MMKCLVGPVPNKLHKVCWYLLLRGSNVLFCAMVHMLTLAIHAYPIDLLLLMLLLLLLPNLHLLLLLGLLLRAASYS
jgi:hypothetical protein